MISNLYIEASVSVEISPPGEIVQERKQGWERLFEKVMALCLYVQYFRNAMIRDNVTLQIKITLMKCCP